ALTPQPVTRDAKIGGRMRFVLVHSPAVGPATWRWVAETLRSQGHDAVVPNLCAAAQTGDPQYFAESAVDAVPPDGEVVLVGPSGAGPLLPVIATQLTDAPRMVVFVDAGLPHVTARSGRRPSFS